MENTKPAHHHHVMLVLAFNSGVQPHGAGSTTGDFDSCLQLVSCIHAPKTRRPWWTSQSSEQQRVPFNNQIVLLLFKTLLSALQKHFFTVLMILFIWLISFVCMLFPFSPVGFSVVHQSCRAASLSFILWFFTFMSLTEKHSRHQHEQTCTPKHPTVTDPTTAHHGRTVMDPKLKSPCWVCFNLLPSSLTVFTASVKLSERWERADVSLQQLPAPPHSWCSSFLLSIDA